MFDWIRYIMLAKVLMKNNDEESIRTAISRLYYGFFGIARRYLINVKNKYYLMSSCSDVHFKVYTELLALGTTEKEVAKMLSKLRGIRNHADYDSRFDEDFFLNFLDENEKKLINAYGALTFLKNNPGF
ncbi:hypothetical protein [uncultured Methanobrevibacter sp.]|uniref:hypothetical protein n=2 Tax=uncultured Methanobrevibacter sp. TaxID=253161 RepID=UPI0025FD92DF|nr:hypothetical protein [uncultured Methanobrevibacter sp.]